MKNILDKVGEEIEFPTFAEKNDLVNEKMRIYLAKLISEEARVNQKNQIVGNYKGRIVLANNYIDACEAAYLKIKENGLEEYLERYPSSKWEVKKINKDIDEEWKSKN